MIVCGVLNVFVYDLLCDCVSCVCVAVCFFRACVSDVKICACVFWFAVYCVMLYASFCSDVVCLRVYCFCLTRLCGFFALLCGVVYSCLWVLALMCVLSVLCFVCDLRCEMLCGL